MSQLSPGCPHCPRGTGVEARPPLSPGWGGDSPDRLQPSGCPVGSWLLSFREIRGSARLVPLPSAHLPTRIPSDEPGMQAGVVAAGIGGDEPCLSCCCPAGLAAESFWFLLAKQGGKSSLCRHIWNTWNTPGWACTAPSSPGSLPQLAGHPQPRCRHFLPTLPSCDCREEILAGDLTRICRVPEERIRLSLRWRGSVSFLPSFLPEGAGAVWHGGRGRWQGQLQQ